MRALVPGVVAATLVALLPVAAPAQAAGGGGASARADGAQLVRGFGAGGRGFGSGRGFGRSSPYGRGYGSRYRYHRRHSFLRRILHGLAIGYLLHLLFATPGGNLVLLLLLGLIAWAVMRLRGRRRYGYR